MLKSKLRRLVFHLVTRRQHLDILKWHKIIPGRNKNVAFAVIISAHVDVDLQ